jgi:hypothetical protein
VASATRHRFGSKLCQNASRSKNFRLLASHGILWQHSKIRRRCDT